MIFPSGPPLCNLQVQRQDTNFFIPIPMKRFKLLTDAVAQATGPRVTTLVVVLVVVVEGLRALAFGAAPSKPGQVAGNLLLAAGYLLLLPAIKRGRWDIAAVMFTHLALFGIAHLLAPAHVALLGGFAAGIQCVVVSLLLLNTPSPNASKL